MSRTVLERTAEHISESAHQASRATCAVADAIEGSLGVVRRTAKKGGNFAEEIVDETTLRIQRHPGLMVATTFAAGFAAGTIIGWIIRRR
jgi:vacuolar-type H+-ATPase catalytic subunit A/Vma1